MRGRGSGDGDGDLIVGELGEESVVGSSTGHFHSRSRDEISKP